METWAFRPLYTRGTSSGLGGFEPSTTIAASVTAQANTAPFSGTYQLNTYCQIQVANQSTAWAFVNFGLWNSVPVATVAASYPVAPGAVVVVTVPAEVSGASVILTAGTGNVTFTRGIGI